MGILDYLRGIFSKKRNIEALQQRFEALQSDLKALQSSALNRTEIEKDSFQLGLAAGYTGKFIKEIENTLNRIESQMPTKDWLTSAFLDYFKFHEQNEEKRFEIIHNLLLSLQKTAEKTPEPIKEELISKINVIKENLPLSPKMEAVLLIIKEFKEISYDELAMKLGIQVSALRGLLTNLARRTNKIERFIREGKGWVRYIGD